MKRIFDLIVSSACIILLLPILLLVSLILLCTGEHKIFYRQARIGINHKVFYIYKFATMLEKSQTMLGGNITTINDYRVLPFGKLLRLTKINELPQLLNVINGTMSCVGPRPLTEDLWRLYSDEYKQLSKNIIPGITGLGSIYFRGEEKILPKEAKAAYEYYANHISPAKEAMETWYINNKSLILDIKICFLTFISILFGTNNFIFKKLSFKIYEY